MTKLELAFLGGGNMGRALIGGLLRHGVRAEQISVGESAAPARESLIRDLGITATADNAAAIEQAGTVVLAVKPQDAGSVLQPLRPILQRNRPLVLSIAAGIRVEALERWCGEGVPVVRAMPNRPALVGAGATGLFATAYVQGTERSAAERVMRSVGEVIWVSQEEQLDVVTALSASGPAYFFLLAELMSRAATAEGLDRASAHHLALATLYGAGLMAHDGDGDLQRLRAEVTSKGGTTEAALKVFESADFAGVVGRAIAAAARRGRELATQFGT
jgi:pyrroline-5-carboxylate reductase